MDGPTLEELNRLPLQEVFNLHDQGLVDEDVMDEYLADRWPFW